MADFFNLAKEILWIVKFGSELAVTFLGLKGTEISESDNVVLF